MTKSLSLFFCRVLCTNKFKYLDWSVSTDPLDFDFMKQISKLLSGAGLEAEHDLVMRLGLSGRDAQ